MKSKMLNKKLLVFSVLMLFVLLLSNCSNDNKTGITKIHGRNYQLEDSIKILNEKYNRLDFAYRLKDNQVDSLEKDKRLREKVDSYKIKEKFETDNKIMILTNIIKSRKPIDSLIQTKDNN